MGIQSTNDWIESLLPGIYPTEATLAILKIAYRLVELLAAKSRPETIGDIHLRIGQLPEKEIRNTVLPSRPNKQIRIRDAAQHEVRCENVLVDLIGFELTALNAARKLPRSMDDFQPAAVRNSHDQRHPLVAGRTVDRIGELSTRCRRQLTQVPNGIQPDVVLRQRLRLLTNRVHQQLHQRVHFRFRTIPVLRAEGVKRQVLDAQLRAGLRNVSDRLNALVVTYHSTVTALARPSAVSIHNNRDVTRNGSPLHEFALQSGVTIRSGFAVYRKIAFHHSVVLETQNIIENDERHERQQEKHSNLLRNHAESDRWLSPRNALVEKEYEMTAIKNRYR